MMLGSENCPYPIWRESRSAGKITDDPSAAGISKRQIAAELAARSDPTPRGGRWYAQIVARVLDRSAL
jgi:hypothetical protein